MISNFLCIYKWLHTKVRYAVEVLRDWGRPQLTYHLIILTELRHMRDLIGSYIMGQIYTISTVISSELIIFTISSFDIMQTANT